MRPCTGVPPCATVLWGSSDSLLVSAPCVLQCTYLVGKNAVLNYWAKRLLPDTAWTGIMMQFMTRAKSL
jgi:hypothetical protein